MTLAWCSRIKSLLLSSAHTLFSLAPAHVASLTSSQFQLPCPFYLLHHWELIARKHLEVKPGRRGLPGSLPPLCLANSYPPFQTQLKCHLFCEGFPQQSQQNSALLCALSTHTLQDSLPDLIIHVISLQPARSRPPAFKHPDQQWAWQARRDQCCRPLSGRPVRCCSQQTKER